MRGHTDVVREAALFKDGRRAVTGSDDRTLQIWDVQKGVLVAGPFEGHTSMSSRAIGVLQENACLESSIHCPDASEHFGLCHAVSETLS